MDGLTKIIAKIKEDNKAECERIVAEANAKAKDIVSKAQLDGKAQAEKIIDDAEEKARLIDAKSKSGADLEYKRCILEAKGDIIGNTISESVEYLAGLDDKTYFANIEKLMLSAALDGEGEMLMSERDASRLPAGFLQEVNAKLTNGRIISISEKHIVTKGGFVLVYPEMRVDCTFEALIDDVSDDIKDELSRILFA